MDEGSRANDKLKYITSSKRKVNDKNYLIRSNRKLITEETTVTLLGVHLDQNLTWSSHVNNNVKCVYHSLHDRNWPSYLRLETVQQNRVLRSNDQGNKIDYGEKHAFQNQCTIFNELPLVTRQCENTIDFEKKARQFYQDRALARALSE